MPRMPGMLYSLKVGGGGGKETGEYEFAASCTLYSQFPPPSLVVPASVGVFCCEKLYSVAKFVSYLSLLLPPWVSCLLPSILPPPVDFPPPYSWAPPPSVLLHKVNTDRILFAGMNWVERDNVE